MQRQRYFDGRTSQDIFETMRLMLNAEFCSYFGAIREDDYEWVIGSDVWNKIIKSDSIKTNVVNCIDSLNYKIFDIEVTISTKELNTITLRKKDINLRMKGEGRNEMPVERKSTSSRVYYAAKSVSAPSIKKVIFNYPATIVLWSDGSKTVVKCQDGDIYDPEKGLAMAISKKALGNKGNYCNEFKKWLPEDEEEEEKTVELRLDTSEICKSLEGLASRIFSNKEK